MTQGYRQIVKSTGLVGIGQVLAIVINMVRVKALALLVGTAGMGIAGLYLSAGHSEFKGNAIHLGVPGRFPFAV
jgi:PST family polysaccharide transporter